MIAKIIEFDDGIRAELVDNGVVKAVIVADDYIVDFMDVYQLTFIDNSVGMCGWAVVDYYEVVKPKH